MPAPANPEELELVRKAICCRIGGCLVWCPKARERFDRDPPIDGLTADGVTEAVIAFVLNAGTISQSKETRPEWNDREFKYKLKIPMIGLPRGLFIEIVMDDPEPDVPTVRIVSSRK